MTPEEVRACIDAAPGETVCCVVDDYDRATAALAVLEGAALYALATEIDEEDFEGAKVISLDPAGFGREPSVH